MLVLPQKVLVKWNNKSKGWYIKKGYTYTKNNDEFEVDVLDLTVHSHQKIQVICDYCEKIILKEFGEYNKTHKNNEDCCNSCKGNKISKVLVKYTFEQVKKEFEKRNFILLENEYKGYVENHKYICRNGHETSITFDALLRGNGCKKCSSQKLGDKKRKSIELVQSIFLENNCILLTTDYKNSEQKLRYICECSNIDFKDLKHFLRGQRCDKCASQKIRKTKLKYNITIVKDIFKENGCVLLEDEFIACDSSMRYICECGRESKVTLSNFLNGVRCKKCAAEKISGENHYNWNPNLTQEEREIKRNIEGYSEWRLVVYERDNYTCQCCGDNHGGNLNAHHLDGYDWCKEKRTDVDNAVTLCTDCHTDFHHQYGYGGNTKEQFEEWIKNK